MDTCLLSRLYLTGAIDKTVQFGLELWSQLLFSDSTCCECLGRQSPGHVLGKKSAVAKWDTRSVSFENRSSDFFFFLEEIVKAFRLAPTSDNLN